MTTDESRSDAQRVSVTLDTLREVWEACPHLQLAQLLTITACNPEDHGEDCCLFSVPDASLRQELARFLEELQPKSQSPKSPFTPISQPIGIENSYYRGCVELGRAALKKDQPS